MSTEQQQGAAMRVLTEEWDTLDEVDKADLAAWSYQLGRAYGAWRVTHETRLEAQQVLTAYDERFESIPEIQDEKRRIVRYQIMALRKAFTYLGLDIEDEDTDA